MYSSLVESELKNKILVTVLNFLVIVNIKSKLWQCTYAYSIADGICNFVRSFKYKVRKTYLLMHIWHGTILL